MHWTVGFTALAHFHLAFVYAQGGSKGRPLKYACPQDNGQKYTTPEPNVVTFELKCGQGTTAQRIDDIPKDSQKECAIHCSEHPGCQSADYNAITKNCARFSEYIQTIPMAGVNTWFPIEERKTQNPEPDEERKTEDPKPDPQPPQTDQCPPTTRAVSESRSDGSSFTSSSSCPDDEGKIFISTSGTYMKIRCTGHVKSKQLAIQPLGTLTECYNYCGNTPGCKSVFWEAGYPGWNCRLYSDAEETNFVECKTPTHGTAFVIDPPTIESPDDPIVLCSTECPMAHGQVYDSPSGERFKMNCCARHGVTVTGTEPMPSLKACMDACGKMPSCQSVDWHQSTGICYFGKHSGDPAISVAGWAAAYSIGCAGACSPKGGCCGSIDSAPVSKPGTQAPMTPDGPLPPPAQCGNQGLRWAEYQNAQGSCSDATYSQFRPEVYKTVTPGSSGVTSSVGGIDALGGQQITVYGGSKPFAGDYFALDHTGYIYASVAGKHKISIDSVDDIVLLWVGATAVKGWTRNNANMLVPLLKSESYEVDIPAGTYMPIRVMFVQGQGRAKFGMKIEGPDGQIIADSSTPNSPWIVQYSCDGLSAPKFPEWGSEE